MLEIKYCCFQSFTLKDKYIKIFKDARFSMLKDDHFVEIP